MPAKQPNRVTNGQITAAKLALDTARRIGDQLRVDLAEATLNDLLDRYHSYHTQRRDK